jgi:hypothetical protein
MESPRWWKQPSCTQLDPIIAGSEARDAMILCGLKLRETSLLLAKGDPRGLRAVELQRSVERCRPWYGNCVSQFVLVVAVSVALASVLMRC